MTAILTALALGAAAGAIDVAPMMRRRTAPVQSIAAIFAQWVLLGLVPFVHWRLPPWLTGMLLGLLGMAPTMILLSLRNPRAIVPTGCAGMVLGAGIGVAGSWLVR